MANKDIELVVDSDDEFNGDYDEPGSLRPEDVTGTVVYTLDWTVGTVVDQIDANPDSDETTGVIVTSPPFQRRVAWNVERQSRFIESLMLGLPVPPLVLAESQKRNGQFYVLDGKQRLTSLKLFVLGESGKYTKLTGMELLSQELEGLTFPEIKGNATLKKYINSMQSQPIRTIVVRNWRTPALLHLIFSRLNKASVPLASHELRQALFPGKFTNFINSRSAQSNSLLRARRLKEKDFRLRDAESLLRYISFRTNLSRYGGDLRDFLDRNLKGGNDHFDEISGQLESSVVAMEGAIDFTFSVFGELAFLRYDSLKKKYTPRFNHSVFDVMTWFFVSPVVRSACQGKEDVIEEAFRMLCSDPEFSSYLTATTKTGQALNGRLSKWGETLGEITGVKVEVNDLIETYLPIAPKFR